MVQGQCTAASVTQNEDLREDTKLTLESNLTISFFVYSSFTPKFLRVQLNVSISVEK
jgi:hypothetical protein